MTPTAPEPGRVGLAPQTVVCLFDLDGVLTDTAKVHASAWKKAFDRVLASTDASGADTAPFDISADYRKYVDGKRREDGVTSFLSSRGIELPEGDPADGPSESTVTGVGLIKNKMFLEEVRRIGVDVYPDARAYLESVTAAGLRCAVVSSSANAGEVLDITGLDRYFETRVDGVVMADRNLPGKPDPAAFLLGAELTGVKPEAAAVFEDAQAGVAAGRAGGFGIVVGVDRVGAHDELMASGADVVVTELTELLS